MTDVVDSQTRSLMMSGIRGKDTKPEIALRKALHKRGFRYRLHDRRVPGHPDLVLPRYRAVVLVHGCFWHRHEACRYATTPATRREFWLAKFEANKLRDRQTLSALAEQDWRVATVWECSLRKPEHVATTVAVLAAWLRGSSTLIDIRL